MEEYLASKLPYGQYLVPVLATFTLFGGAVSVALDLYHRIGKDNVLRIGLILWRGVKAAGLVFVLGLAVFCVAFPFLPELQNLTLGESDRPAPIRSQPVAAVPAQELPAKVETALGMTFVLIRPGKFLMGSPGSETGHGENEQQQEVELTHPYYLSAYEVTQGQYAAVMGANPSHFSPQGKGRDLLSPSTDTKRLPVDSVTLADAEAFCAAYAKLTQEKAAGRVYRLPTEAEWEYACRAGTSTAFPFASKSVQESANVAGDRPVAVGSYPANAWGLYDMIGNVREWCADGYLARRASLPARDPFQPASSSQVLRGGSWDLPAVRCRSAFRDRTAPADQRIDIGFRLAFTP